ncbi:AMP-dependent synthetase/ligase [Ruminiclostridium cellulolyticum]|uniref:AMP-dependent synthetase and ligase n=1 Tax=Ruminiclostridium cellulolyticum (strain ATCC 35319 / DSM 5812 / JCM 6584 / H10) TaxID=394503 RepID=B8I8N5_RUMCH|nr:AMP-binding protein [Ruminiclostridium cellulolyticum]ACL75268.1 AMP-dependent synthetase and ligase [Ruminiclostridium cellulolyticum H10]
MAKNGISITNEKDKRIVKGLGYYEISPVENIKELLKASIDTFRDKTAFIYKSGTDIITKSYNSFGAEVAALGTALHSIGLKGKRIAVISENRYKWALSFFSIVSGTGIAVPLDKHLPEVEIEKLIIRGEVDAIFYSNHFDAQMLSLAERMNSIEYFICMDDIGENYPTNFTTIDRLLVQGESLIKNGDRSFTEASVDSEKLSVLLFTSGTTSISKGVMLNQRNICADVSAVSSAIKVMPNDVHLSLLPLHHTFELSVGMIFMIKNGITIAYSEGIKHIAKNLKEFNVTILVVVPAILEAMYKKMKEGIKKSGKSRQVAILAKVSKGLKSIKIDLRRKFFKRILDQMGPGLRLAVSGAAPIDKEIIEGFDMLGLKVIQGYGLTETSPVVAANNDFYNKAGTVGQPLFGIETAIYNPDENGMGEIITRGRNVMMGYYNDEAATKESIDEEGWFHTGDLGYIDDEGFITITGRAKSMIVLTNGKKAFPEEYETILNNIEGIKESFVWGNEAPDGDIQVCAKLVLNEDVLKEKYGRIPSEKELADIMQQEIKTLNRDIPQYKIIRYFIMSYEELVKTTTLKIKRPVEYKKVKENLDNAGLTMRKANGKLF